METFGMNNVDVSYRLAKGHHRTLLCTQAFQAGYQSFRTLCYKFPASRVPMRSFFVSTLSLLITMRTCYLDIGCLPNIAVDCFMCRLAVDSIKGSAVRRMKIGNAGQIVLVGGPTPGLGSE